MKILSSINSKALLLLSAGFLLSFLGVAQPSRSGSIDLTGGGEEGRYILMNHQGSGQQMGIEGGSFTIEAWIYMTQNYAEDFNFFRLISGDKVLTVSYKGDGERNSNSAWSFETRGLPEKNGGGWYFTRGYKSGYTAPTFLNQWHHVAFSVDEGSTIKLYIDGERVIYSTLTHNGNALADLWPAAGDGKCEIGGASIHHGIKGTFYTGEVRVWDAQLSDATISEHYDKEVNKAHPNWNKLVRYYHGNESYGTDLNRKFQDRSPSGTRYDAVIHKTDVGVNINYSPIIKPPKLSSPVFNFNLTARQCETLGIPISWDNFRYSSLGYIDSDNRIWYRLTRLSDGKIITDGTSSNGYDNTVNKGDKQQYKLQAYWKIDGVEIFSDPLSSNFGSIKMQYDAPGNFIVSTDNCDKSIDLSWSATDGTPPNWTIQRANDAAFTQGVTTIKSDLEGNNTSYTLENQEIEVTRYYRVFASGKDDNGCTVSGVYSSVKEGRTSSIPAAPTEMSIVQNLANKSLEISWTAPEGSNADSWIIRRANFDGSNVVEFTTDLGTTSYIDTDLKLCQTYSYTIGAVNECAPDGNFATTDLTGNISTDLSDAIAFTEASKGYFGDAVQIEWGLNSNLSNIDRFRIYRSRADKNNFTLLKVLDNDLIYTDETAVGGVFYNYKVVGEAACEDKTIYTNEGINMGFVLPYGVANGHVEYDGGNAVENVTVNFEKQSTQSTGRSLAFDGNSYVETNSTITELGTASFTMEAWIKTTCTDCGIINKSNGDYAWEMGEKVMYIDGNGYLSFVGHSSNYIITNTIVNDNEWHHVAIGWDNETKTAKAFVDGESVQLTTNSYRGMYSDASYTFQLGRPNGLTNEAKNFFTGYIDEIRVWNALRSDIQIANNYNRYINSGNENLTAYWRCDEGIGNNIFDASKTEDEFNKHDGTFIGNIAFSTIKPSSDLLGIRGITNQFGDYTVDYIPYSSGGEIFKVTPALGQHAFEPSSRTVFIGDGAKTQNGLDFTDISAFQVSGKVTYENSQVPVEGVAILIDGIHAVGSDNQPVRTDSEGNYTIQVPIGYHFLSTEKDGHTFSEGYFPQLNQYGDVENYEFTEDLTINFVDNTKIKLAGRIVGGTYEGDKKIGFDLSLNNVGVADVTLRLQSEGYDLDITNDDIYDVISVTTDPYSGEYEIELIPEKWIVEKAGNDRYFINSSDIPVLDLSNSLDEIVLEDSTNSTFVNGTLIYDVETYSYHHKQNFIIRQTPSLHVYDSQGEEFDGDSEIIYTSQQTGDRDTLNLENAGFNFPVFTQAKDYEMKIYVYEKYENPDYPDGPIVDLVPVKDAEISVTDNLGINPTGTSGKTIYDGSFSYIFKAGVPSLSENGEYSYTKTLQVNASIGNENVVWPETDIFRGYILGGLPQEGSDFVTYGPEVVEMVLRDPPGSNSYAFIEKGSTFSRSELWEMNVNSNIGLNNTWHNGMYFGVGGGLAGPIVQADLVVDSELGMEIERKFNDTGEYTETWTFNERIETSSDPEDVGSDADIYIGKAHNAYITKTKSLALIERTYCEEFGLDYLDTGNDIVLGIIDGYAIDEGNTATYFAYSQRHIVEELIPELLVLRDELFKSGKYESHLPWGHQFYGVSNDNNTEAFQQFKLDTLAANPAIDTTQISYTFNSTGANDEIDSVAFLNEQLRQWINAIALNEAEKVEAATTKNISIDGSGGAISEQITETHSSQYNWKAARTLNFAWNAKFGAITNGKGFTLRNIFDLGVNITNGGSGEKEHNVTFGYVIDERDEGDYYSIDVKNTQGIEILNKSKFSDFIPSKKDFIETQAIKTGIGIGATAVKSIGTKLAYKYTMRTHSFIATAAFAVDAAVFIYELSDASYNLFNTYDKQDNVGLNNNISGFSISSPIFSVRGGQSRCPYEGGEETSFYVENNEPIKLHTATLLRENPKIDAEPAVRKSVPENEKAVFTLKLQNESESNSDIWYEITVDEASNPDGAIILIDGLTAERSYLVPAWETVTKTLTIQRGASGVLDYDSIAVILHSACQFDPMTSQADIADTVYLSAHFQPACSNVELEGLADNWVVNYEDDNQVAITLKGYDINHPALEKIDFQYKSLSGNPIAVKSYFMDSLSSDYTNYGDQAELIDNRSEVSFIWDISELTDRTYQIRARATCTDGSVTETDYLTGVIDRVTPVPFGTPQPSDGILNPADDISIRFNEEIESGLVKDHNISVRSILNGSDVSHATSVSFNGVNEKAKIPAITLNNKSFTLEYWLKRDAGSSGIVFTKGSGADLLEIAFSSDETISIKMGLQTFDVNPAAYYSSVTPVNAWHHWGLAYNKETHELIFFMDDQLLTLQNNILFSANDVENAYLASDVSGVNPLKCQIHEVRLWNKALPVSESVEYMNQTLSGNENHLYGYWPMDEGDGVIALDKTAGRNMTFNASWNLFPGSDAFKFNGSNQYLTLDGNNIVITNETDYTIEFWFMMSTPNSVQTIFSSGKGDLTDTLYNTEFAMSINALPSGQINVVSNGNTFVATKANYFDNHWHHFALVVDRDATTKSYIDGKLQISNSNPGIAGLAGSQLWLGARGAKTSSSTVAIDQYYKGNIDEFRIWNSARPVKYINNYKNTKLTGSESGLIAYLPFETYEEVMGTIVRSTTLSDEATPLFLTQAGPAIANGGETYTEGASIKDSRPVQDIPFDFVVNDDEIVITPLVDDYKIEGQTLEISVSDIRDLNGNKQLSTASWTAYVQQNELVWQENTIEVSQNEGSSTTFSVTIANLGGISMDYDLENMPAWLSTNESTGTVPANSTKTLVFEVNAGLNVGYYERSINLSTFQDFNEQLTITVKVVTPAPDWNIDIENHEYSMNVFGKLIIDNVVSIDENDIVAAYVGDEIRGLASPEYIETLDEYLLFMTVYSNVSSNEKIQFKVWDASNARIHEDVTPDISFIANKIVGTTANPQEIIASEAISTSVDIKSGWNWISFNLESDDLKLVNNIFGSVGDQGDVIKGQTAIDIYDSKTGWLGGISLNEGGLKVGKMYKVYLKNGGTIKYSGTPVNPESTAIQLDAGWNYTGYTPQVTMTIPEALAGVNPATGDMIKSQNKFAMYDASFGWVGSLKNLNANEGYMIYSSKVASFYYPETSSLSSGRILTQEDEQIKLPDGIKLATAHQFADNISIIADISEEMNINENDVLLAHSNGEVRGYAKRLDLGNGKYAFFLTVHGNTGDQITFSLYNEESQTLTEATNQLDYVGNAIVGAIDEPYLINLGEEVIKETSIAYPNPFKNELNLSLQCEDSYLEIYNSLGVIIKTLEVAGSKAIVNLETEIPNGTYLIKVVNSCGIETLKVIKAD
ncbi:LamG-like jellyroll fold domain-containing protein [Marinigracilibium pacificum]|uniref:T9SS type A sorting domain-containing protein n=1 Tax=Marinigracilibium pacificum TaxID=2729599 RepID=A0A848J5A4_9BACT|nr:LamG-like jellyroll fold domain-containing protein [Marinigracilibium pacificum]NMM49539.1 T9SS type A sorting domain-containing protein [Marinigracilibium pacificum]